MFFYLHEFDHTSPKKTEASKLTANHVGLSSKKRENRARFILFGILQGQSKRTDGLTQNKNRHVISRVKVNLKVQHLTL